MISGLKQGKNPLAYLGVEPQTPPMMIVEQRDPTDNDYAEYVIGSLWVVTSVPKLWIMVNKNPSATDKWVQVYPGDGSGTNFFETDAGTASENAGTIKILGSTNGISTTGTSDLVTIALDDDLVIGNSLSVSTMNEGVVVSDNSGLLSSINGTDLQFFVAETGNAPSFATLVSEDGSVTFANGTVPGTVNIQSIGGGGGSGFLGLIGENSVTATPLAEKVSVYGDELTDDLTNIYTEASGHKINIFHSPLLSLGETTTNGYSGVIRLDSKIYFSALGPNNLFVGKESGNLSLNVIACHNNVGLGTYVLRSANTTANNTAIGYNSLTDLHSGAGGNCCLGLGSGTYLQEGESNILIGQNSGIGLNSNESYNIIIGDTASTPGTNNTIDIGFATTNECNIKGIYSSATTLDSDNGVVQIDKNHKLAKTKGTTGQVLTSTATGVTWATPSTSSSRYAFYAYQDIGPAWNLPYGTDYLLGTKAVFAAPLNQGGAFYIGDGTSVPCSYTALETGVYQFNIIVVLEDDYKVGQVNIWKNVGLNLYTPTRNYFQSFLQPYGGGTARQFTTDFLWNWSVVADLTVGDVVTFGVTYDPEGGTVGQTYNVLGVGAGGRGGIATSISGYKI